MSWNKLIIEEEKRIEKMFEILYQRYCASPFTEVPCLTKVQWMAQLRKQADESA
jgi:hypothetical protein